MSCKLPPSVKTSSAAAMQSITARIRLIALREVVPVGNLIRLASEAESRNVSML